MIEVVPNFIYRVKRSNDPRRVLYIKGLGYWIAPMTICVSYTTKSDKMVVCIKIPNQKSCSLTQTSAVHTKAIFKQFIEKSSFLHRNRIRFMGNKFI